MITKYLNRMYCVSSVLLQFSDSIIVHNIYTHESPRYLNIDESVVVNVGIVMLNSLVTASKSISKVLSARAQSLLLEWPCNSGGCPPFIIIFPLSKIRYPSLFDGKNVTLPLFLSPPYSVRTPTYTDTRVRRRKKVRKKLSIIFEIGRPSFRIGYENAHYIQGVSTGRFSGFVIYSVGNPKIRI